jgi:hypothetical protein
MTDYQNTTSQLKHEHRAGIAEYLVSNPEAGSKEVAQGTGLSIETIERDEFWRRIELLRRAREKSDQALM